MSEHRFTAVLWVHGEGGPGAWHFLTLPPATAEDLRTEAGPRRGFGSVRVEARLGGTTWRTSLFPDAASGSFVLPVKRQVRLNERLDAGSPCSVAVRLLP